MLVDKRLKEDGYIVFKQILDTRKLSEIKAEIVYVFNKQIQRLGIDEGNFEKNLIKFFETDLEAYKYTGKVVQNLISIHELMVCPTILNILTERCGMRFPTITTKAVAFLHNKNLASDPIYYKVPWHQDYESVRSSLNSVVVWVPLIDVPENLGPLRLVPKSHLKGAQWTKVSNNFGLCNDQDDFISVPVNKGDMVVFNQMLVHASGDNIYDDRVRFSVNLRYGDLDDSYWIDNKYECPYVYNSVPKSFEGPSEQEMMEYFK